LSDGVLKSRKSASNAGFAVSIADSGSARLEDLPRQVYIKDCLKHVRVDLFLGVFGGVYSQPLKRKEK